MNKELTVLALAAALLLPAGSLFADPATNTNAPAATGAAPMHPAKKVMPKHKVHKHKKPTPAGAASKKSGTPAGQ